MAGFLIDLPNRDYSTVRVGAAIAEGANVLHACADCGLSFDPMNAVTAQQTVVPLGSPVTVCVLFIVVSAGTLTFACPCRPWYTLYDRIVVIGVPSAYCVGADHDRTAWFCANAGKARASAAVAITERMMFMRCLPYRLDPFTTDRYPS